jgi:hypothetical protein
MINFSWHVDFKTYAPRVAYCGRLDSQHGCGMGYFAIIFDPMKGNQKIIPNMFIHDGGHAQDPGRIRINNTSVNNVKFNSASAIYE